MTDARRQILVVERDPVLGRPGQLDGLVLDYMRKQATKEPLGPTAVAKGLGRSSGAVGNCLKRLAAAGHVRQAGEHPLRYTAVKSARS
jgi:nitric oxide reductase NorQ protein